MYTAMALVALTLGNVPSSPTWLDDYSAAQAKVSVARKPMAVFIGSGKAGWESAVRDGFDPAVSKMLAEKFVCLYVDSSTTRGRVLAAAFQVGDRGVVLSDQTGLTQAYSAAGTISRAELSRALVTYSDVQVAQKTDAPTGPAPSGGVVITPPPAHGAPMAVPAHVVGGPVMGGGPVMVGGHAHGWGQPAADCGHEHGHQGNHGHGCCLFGGGWGGGSKCGMGGGCGHSAGCGTGHGHGHGYGMSHGGGHGCGFFGGMGGGWGGGWGGGCGGGWGHGGGCH